jgi:WS/DGAT/MGAT family acyltransferase
MSEAKRSRISGVDTAWLRMDQPTNLMMIVGVMMFEGKLDLRKVRRIVAARFLAFPRFGQCAVQDAVGAWWESPEHFDINAHVERVALPGAGGKIELENLVSELAATPLDPARPLWHFLVVENYLGGSALVTRIHHCYADGIALIRVMLSLTDGTAEGSLEAKPPAFVPVAAEGGGDILAQILKPISGAIDGARALAASPARAGAALQAYAAQGRDLATEVARIALMGRDTETRFKGPLGMAKRAAWADPLPLADVKAVGKALNCSINDVLLSLAAGALRDYLADQGDPVDGVQIRVIVPVNLRPIEEGHKLGNQFGLVFLELPLAVAHPLERLYEIRRRMRELKGSYQPMIAYALLSAVGMGPRALQDQVTQVLGANASAVVTNVPGPQQPLFLAGRRITELNFWVPQSGGIGMGISILSYDGGIQFGVVTDAGLVPDPERIVNRFKDEFEKLMWMTLMTAWGEDADEGSKVKGERSKVKGERKRAAKGTPKESTASPPVPKRFRNL